MTSASEKTKLELLATSKWLQIRGSYGQVEYGKCCTMEKGVPKELISAALCFQRVANQGDESRIWSWIVALYEGCCQIGGLDNVSLAKYDLMKASRGNAQMRLEYGKCLESGIHVAKK